MEPHVGGRMETVAARPITDPGDRLRLVALLVVAVAVHVWLLNHTFVTARDGIGFARYAMQVGHPSMLSTGPDRRVTIVDVLKDHQHPPGFPLAVYATSLAVKAVYQPGGPHELQDQMLFAVQLTTAIGGILLVFPTYWLGRSLFGKFAGFAAALLFQVLPVPAHITSDGLTEGVYLLGLATTLLFGVRAIGKPTVGRFLQCGLATGVTYLVRPEGALAGVTCGLVALSLVVVRQWAVRPAAGWLTALAVGAAIPAVPYMVLIGGITNKPSVNGVIDNLMNPRGEMMKTWGKEKTEAPALPRPALFGAWFQSGSTENRAMFVLGAIVKESLKSIFFAPVLWVVFGIASVRRRLRVDPRLWVPVLFAVLYLLVLMLLGYKIGYVSERHTLPLVLIGCLFAAAGLEPAGQWAQKVPGVRDLIAVLGGPRRAAAITLGAIAVAAVPATLKPLHEHRVGHKYAGAFLADNVKETDTLVDPFEWAQFYGGTRALYSIPADPENPRYIWAVMEASKTDAPMSRLHRFDLAQNVAKDGRSEIAYRWPENPNEKPRVVVYRLDPNKP